MRSVTKHSEHLCAFKLCNMYLLINCVSTRISDCECGSGTGLSVCSRALLSSSSSHPHPPPPPSSSSSIGTSAPCGLWPVEQCPSIFSHLPPTLSIFALPTLEDLFLLPLSIFSWVFRFFLSLPVLEWRYFWACYPSSFSLGDLTSLSFARLSILPYFLICSSLVVLDSSYFSIPRFHI